MVNKNKNSYIQNGIVIDPATLQPHRHATLTYNGLLTHNGANAVYAHVGFDREWKNKHDYKMTRKANGFEADIVVEDGNALNVVFKDCANNWDNNSGQDYTFDIAHK